MFSINKNRTRTRKTDKGVVWPNNGSGAAPEVDEVFGHRPFSNHISTVGYDNDFHRGIDIDAALGDPVYSPIAGSVIRLHHAHFDFKTREQFDRFDEVDVFSRATFSSVTGTNLRIFGLNAGLQSYTSPASKFIAKEPFSASDDFDSQITITSNLSNDTRVGLGVEDSVNNEYAAVWHESDAGGGTSNFNWTIRDSSGITNGSGTATRGGSNWLRVRYDQSTTTIFFEHSTDGDTWSALNGAGNTVTWTETSQPVFKPLIAWIDGASTTVSTIDISFFGTSTPESPGRRGNWILITNNFEKTLLYHLQSFIVNKGDLLQAGQKIGTAGKTGFDDRSGRVTDEHIHVERIPSNEYAYTNNDATNPLDKAFLPRKDDNINVSVIRTNELDPDSVDSWRLQITVDRSNGTYEQDFDLGSVTLTGNLATRSIDINTRAGLNSDQDIPLNNGVYISASSFDDTSASYIVNYYFHRSVVGTTFTNYVIKDSFGRVVASEPTMGPSLLMVWGGDHTGSSNTNIASEAGCRSGIEISPAEGRTRAYPVIDGSIATKFAWSVETRGDVTIRKDGTDLVTINLDTDIGVTDLSGFTLNSSSYYEIVKSVPEPLNPAQENTGESMFYILGEDHGYGGICFGFIGNLSSAGFLNCLESEPQISGSTTESFINQFPIPFDGTIVASGVNNTSGGDGTTEWEILVNGIGQTTWNGEKTQNTHSVAVNRGDKVSVRYTGTGTAPGITIIMLNLEENGTRTQSCQMYYSGNLSADLQYLQGFSTGASTLDASNLGENNIVPPFTGTISRISESNSSGTTMTWQIDNDGAFTSHVGTRNSAEDLDTNVSVVADDSIAIRRNDSSNSLGTTSLALHMES